MTRLLLVRHAEPAATWGDHDDPGLSERGVGQAEALAARLAAPAARCPRTVVSWPLARARETAAPLAGRLEQPVGVDARVGEIVSPDGAAATRTAWLRDVFARRWPELSAELRGWRRGVLDALAGIGDAVVTTHFVAINVAVGAATGDDQVRCCSPAHTSVTELSVDEGRLTLVRLGAELPATSAR